MNPTPTTTDPTTWALDREIVLVRVLDAPREAVYTAWTDANAFCEWFGPDGFTCTVRETIGPRRVSGEGRPGRALANSDAIGSTQAHTGAARDPQIERIVRNVLTRLG